MNPRIVPLVAAAVAASLVAGCASVPDEPMVGAAAEPSLAVVVPNEAALVRLPEAAGRIVSVVERRTEGARNQTVTLAGDGSSPGADRIEARIGAHRSGDLAGRRSAEEIAADLERLLPGRTPRIGDRPIVTSVGSFGWAIGEGERGGLCLVAWTDTTIDRPSGSLGGLDDEARDLSVRMRLCRRGASEADLLARLAATRAGPG